MRVTVATSIEPHPHTRARGAGTACEPARARLHNNFFGLPVAADRVDAVRERLAASPRAQLEGAEELLRARPAVDVEDALHAQGR